MVLAGRVHTIYTDRWVQGLQAGVQSTHTAEIEIYRPGASVYVLEDDAWHEDKTLYFEGWARVQPVRADQRREVDTDATVIRVVRVQIPVDSNTVNMRPGDRMEVKRCDRNPALQSYEYVLEGVVDSSNPFERTLSFTVNQETDAASITQGGSDGSH